MDLLQNREGTNAHCGSIVATPRGGAHDGAMKVMVAVPAEAGSSGEANCVGRLCLGWSLFPCFWAWEELTFGGIGGGIQD